MAIQEVTQLLPSSLTAGGLQMEIGHRSDPSRVRSVLNSIKSHVIIHTANPKFDSPNDILYHVNVNETKTITWDC